MKTEKIIVNFGSEKLKAIKILAPEVYAGLEKQLNDCLEKIYQKTVPPHTRTYIEESEKLDAAEEQRKQKKTAK